MSTDKVLVISLLIDFHCCFYFRQLMNFEILLLQFAEIFLEQLQSFHQHAMPFILFCIIKPMFCLIIICFLYFEIFIESLSKYCTTPVIYAKAQRLPEDIVYFFLECQSAYAPNKIVTIFVHEKMLILIFFNIPASRENSHINLSHIFFLLFIVEHFIINVPVNMGRILSLIGNPPFEVIPRYTMKLEVTNLDKQLITC